MNRGMWMTRSNRVWVTGQVRRGAAQYGRQVVTGCGGQGITKGSRHGTAGCGSKDKQVMRDEEEETVVISCPCVTT